jgi:hypothetical protein
MLSEGVAAHPDGCDSPLQMAVMAVEAVWHPFCLNSNILGRVWQPSADNNGVPNDHYYLQMAVIPDQTLSRTVCSGQ